MAKFIKGQSFNGCAPRKKTGHHPQPSACVTRKPSCLISCSHNGPQGGCLVT
jgi:hypothetical protein